MDKTARWVKSRFGYTFAEAGLLAAALTHRSADGPNNERLEFLGDAVLDCVISDIVYRRRPAANEGELSRLRASLVRDATLAEIADALGISDYLILGTGEKKSGGHRRNSIMAGALEAIFGAVYLDAGFAAADRVIRRIYAPLTAELPDSEELKDAKTRLQELVQSDGRALPVYELEKVSGKAHRQTFEVSCSLEADGLRTVGRGLSRRDAEQQAAARMLDKLDPGE
ncbi:MAG: ribonuclease III [Gammaproteobacteria bacterium]|nr:ribonuclease III [Gammaproteobacteria bacterium]MDH4252897.1 ribonuclease III [Gammaproteobacteria bacterium]MDH5308417.1 ribonuclease III [Gammaproteobacteria bacterium]